MFTTVTNSLFGRAGLWFLSVFLFLSTVAAPAVALVAAGSVNSSSIVDGSVKARDIASGAVSTPKLRDAAVSARKIRDGTIKNTDISAKARIQDYKINYSQKTKILNLSTAVFEPFADGIDYVNYGTVLALASGPGGSFVAPVELPDGARIKKIRAGFLDDGAGDISITLFRRLLTATVPGILGQTPNSSGSSASWRFSQDDTISNPVIDNANYGYSLLVTFTGAGASLIFGGAKITYAVKGP